MKKWIKKNLLVLVAILGVTAFLGQQIQASKQSQQYYVVILPTYHSDLYFNGSFYAPGTRQDDSYGTNGSYTTSTVSTIDHIDKYEIRGTHWYYNGAWRV